MNYQLLDFKGEMTSLREKVEKHAFPYKELPDVETGLRDLAKIYETKFDATQPEVMVFGIYNAGKSSIINELIGADLAKVADVPTTDCVDYHDWNGYRLADTPGVGAPIEHTRVTQEHLKKADVVIFVMSTTGSNERRENYERMKEIADAGKKIIIVLNDKNGDLCSPEGDATIQAIKDKVAVNMERVGIKDAAKKYYIVAVNAARAKKGRETGNEAFLNKSNMAELTNVIMQELKKTGPFEILSNAAHEAEAALQPMIEGIAGMEKAAGAHGAAELLERLRLRRKDLRDELAAAIDSRADRLGRQLPGTLWALINKPEEADRKVLEEVAKTAQLVQKDLENKIRDLVEEMRERAEDIEVRIKEMTFEPNAIRVNVQRPAEEVQEAFDFSSARQRMTEVLKGLEEGGLTIGATETKGGFGMGDMLAPAAGKVVAEGVKELTKTTLGKTVLSTVVGKTVLAPILPVIGPVITTLPLLIKLLGGSDDSERMRAEAEARNRQAAERARLEAQAREELAQKCMYVAADLADTFKVAVEENLQNIAAEIAKPFKEESRRLGEKARTLQEDLSALREAADAYHVLYGKLRASAVAD